MKTNDLSIKQKTKLIKALSKAMKEARLCCVTLDTYDAIKSQLTDLVQSL